MRIDFLKKRGFKHECTTLSSNSAIIKMSKKDEGKIYDDFIEIECNLLYFIQNQQIVKGWLINDISMN